MPLMSLAIMTLQPVAGKSALLSKQRWISKQLLLTLPQASRLGILRWSSSSKLHLDRIWDGRRNVRGGAKPTY